MPRRPLIRVERVARRDARRSEVRRRRIVLLTSVAAVVTVALALGLRTASDEQPALAASGQVPSTNAPSRANRTPARSAPAPQSPRSRLGSGKPVTFAFGGDVHFESPIRERLASSPSSVLAPMAPLLTDADIAMVNLETAVTERGAPQSKAFTFRAPASSFSALRAGSVDVVSVANNHGLDFGPTGLRDTLAAARQAGVSVVGAGRDDEQAYAPHRVTVRGQHIAIIGATQVLDDHLISAWTAGPGRMGLASAKDEPRLLRAVREARSTSDTVVVFLHWGAELSSCPTSSQRSLARKLARAGADVVVGSHAHVLLGAGTLKGALVAYGLGNFVFYAWRESTTQSGVLEVTVTGRRIDSYRWRPARISDGIPRPLTGSSRARALADWRALRSCTHLRP
jgi:poly-gamma-glutamate capsule biosynthesis protein CapA/YwtB (metallophosphatase superfamily)